MNTPGRKQRDLGKRATGKPLGKRKSRAYLIVAVAGIAAIVVVILVSLLAGGSSTKKASSPQTSTTGSNAPSSSKLVAVPDFRLPTFDGGTYALSQDQGKVRVIFFMIAPY